jgi:hypothetical protein
VIKEEWFWLCLFPVLSVIIGSILTIIANTWKEKSRRKTQIELEKIRMYDEKKFQAYTNLDEFLNKAYSYYWPPNEPEQDFITLMKKYYFTKVKVNYRYFKKDIKEKISILESQYNCLRESDFIPQIPFDKFFHSEYLKILNELNEIIQKAFENWGKK